MKDTAHPLDRVPTEFTGELERMLAEMVHFPFVAPYVSFDRVRNNWSPGALVYRDIVALEPEYEWTRADVVATLNMMVYQCEAYRFRLPLAEACLTVAFWRHADYDHMGEARVLAPRCSPPMMSRGQASRMKVREERVPSLVDFHKECRWTVNDLRRFKPSMGEMAVAWRVKRARRLWRQAMDIVGTDAGYPQHEDECEMMKRFGAPVPSHRPKAVVRRAATRRITLDE